MLHCNNSIQETHYDILSIKEDATYEEIRTSYKLAVLNHHPDKLQIQNTSDPQNKFLKVQEAWKILSNKTSRAIYDNELRALRKDVGGGVAEDVSLEDMMIEDGGEVLELFYQCRCGDYFSVDSLELEKMGYTLLRDENKVSFQTTDPLSASVLLPCGSCSLLVRFLIHSDVKLQIDEHL